MAAGATAAKLHLSSAAAAGRRPSLLHLAAVAVLCSLSYLLGIWHHGGFSTAPAAGAGAAVSIATAVSCASPTPTVSAGSSSPSSAGPLDFAAHHTAEGMEAEAAPRQRAYEACPPKYSEYTPFAAKRGRRAQTRRLHREAVRAATPRVRRGRRLRPLLCTPPRPRTPTSCADKLHGRSVRASV